ncbi:MAG TPA: DUF6152 family protein [Vicinamibacterales bacterium]|nr:DUF6152 family protein [Vicinamibacterales bacterium]
MHTQSRRSRVRFTASLAAALALMLTDGAVAHHSFAMFDRAVIQTFTGVVSHVEPGADHLQIFFAPMNEQRDGVERDEQGKPIVWSLEMTGAASVAKYGITTTGFPPGTVFSASLHPARDGAHAAVIYRDRDNRSVLVKCRERQRPAPGKHCDSVEGATLHGADTKLATPTERAQ